MEVDNSAAALFGWWYAKKYWENPGNQLLFQFPWFRFLDAVDGAVDAVRESGIDAVEDHNMDDYLGAVAEWRVDF